MTLLSLTGPDDVADADASVQLSQAVTRIANGAGPEPLLKALIALDPAVATAWLRAQCTHQEDAARAAQYLPLLVAAAAAKSELWPDLAHVLDAINGEGVDGRTVAAIVEAGRDLIVPERRRALLERVRAESPHDPVVLRAAVAVSLELGDADAFHDQLTRLGQVDPNAATVRWCQRMRDRLPARSVGGVRMALLGSATLDLLSGYVDLETRALHLRPEIYAGPFNGWVRECLDPTAGLRQFTPEVIAFAVHLDDLIPSLAGAVSPEHLETEGNDAVASVVNAVQSVRTWSDALVLVHDFDTAYRDPIGVAARPGAGARQGWLDRLNVSLRAALADMARVYVLDSRAVVARRASGSHDDPRMRHFARMRMTPPIAHEFARQYAAHLAPLKGQTRKCVVLDLDNTLWGGVIGEDGMQGIRLGATSPGSEYVEFQQFLHGLMQRGVLLAVNSKNNAADALEAIRTHPSMVLREDAFSAMRINWQPKSNNMVELARELNIGLDAMVFIDDNPNERALMRQALPEVLTVDLPTDAALYRSAIEALPQLQVLQVTAEDRARTEMYRAQQQRAEIRTRSHNVEEYLASLGIRVAIDVDDARAVLRVHQLLQRTNQFNLTTRRHSAASLEAWLHDDAWRAYTLRARDRFGDHGLVAVALVQRSGTRHRIDSFLMSCRVISYGIETALLARVIEDARHAGAEVVVGEYIATAKNAPARDFYGRHGFQAVGGGSVEEWTLSTVDAELQCPSWIALEAASAT